MSSHKSFKKAAGLMLVAVLASRILGLVREMLIAKQFGQTGAVSAYTAAFNIPDLLYFFLSSGALSSAFIPVFTERFKTGKQKEAWQIFSIIACFMGLVLTLAGVIAWIYAKPLACIFSVPGFVESDPKLVQLTVYLTRIILPCQLFFFIGGVMMATLESRQKFSARAAGPVIYNIGIIFGAIVLSRWFHIAGLAFGTLIGAFVGNIVYTFYCMKREGYEFYPSLNIRHPGVVRVAKLALPVILGLGLPQIDVMINKLFASYISTTAPAALNYANRLMQVPLGIFAQAAGTAILPMLAAYAAKHAYDDMRSGVAEGLRSIMVESLPATVFMIVMADPLVRTIYMSGQFRPSDVAGTVIPLIWYSVGIFAWAGQAIVARGFFALQDTRTPVVIGTVSTAIFIPINYLLMQTMGIGGIAFATTIAISFHFLALTWVLRKRLNGLESVKTLKTVGKILVASAAMGVVCFGIRIGMSRAVGSWQMQDGDIKHPVALMSSINQSQKPLEGYLYSKLTPETREMLASREDADKLAVPLKRLLIDEMNRLARDNKLYDESRFTKVTLIGETAQLAKNHATDGKSLLRMNRGLLESAYSGSINKITDPSALDNMLRKKQSRKEAIEGGSKWLFEDSDVKSPLALVYELRSKKNLVSKYIMAQMSPATRQMLDKYIDKREKSDGLQESFMHDLNVAITKDSIYTPERFAGVNLPAKVVSLANGHPQGKALAKLNRHLLEAVYPNEIAKRPFVRVESRMNSAITIIIAMLLGGAVYFGLLRLLKVTEMDFLWSALRRKFSRKPNGNSEPVEVVDEMPD